MEEASFTGREGVELAAKFIRQVWESVSVIEKSANV